MIKKLIFFAVLIIVVLLFVGGTRKDSSPVTHIDTGVAGWNEYEKNPVIQYGDVQKDILWNDPSVIKEDDVYKMWLSGGEPFSDQLSVQIYYATSKDGLEWDIDETPVLTPTPGMWDSRGAETPSVIKVGDTYHMYYTGYNTPFSEARYSIGHATSKDGIVWTKDSQNPIIAPQEDPLKWGFFTTAEPGVVHHNGTFYLYYASAKSNYPNPGAPFGIILATSKDGSSFKEVGLVHSLTSSYDSNTYRGYSTPMVYVREDMFYMYHTVVYNPDGFESVAISSAKSSDGKNFTESEVNIFTTRKGDWKDHSVLAPTVLHEDGKVQMWFAGQKSKPGRQFDYGIGYAEKDFSKIPTALEN